MEKDCKASAAEDKSQVNNPDGETAEARLQFALRLCEEARVDTERLIHDLATSVNTVSRVVPKDLEEKLLIVTLFCLRNSYFSSALSNRTSAPR